MSMSISVQAKYFDTKSFVNDSEHFFPGKAHLGFPDIHKWSQEHPPKSKKCS